MLTQLNKLQWSGVSIGFNVPTNTFQSITCTGTDNLTRTTKQENTQSG